MKNEDIIEIIYGHEEHVLIDMLNNGSFDTDIDTKFTILNCACIGSLTAFVEAFLNRNPDLKFDGSNELAIKAMESSLLHYKSAKAFLDHGAEVNLVNKDGNSMLIISSRRAVKKTVEMLIARGAEINFRGNGGLTSLSRLIKKGGALSVINLLLDKGADVNIPDDSNETPLYLAAESGWSIPLLLDHNPDPHVISNRTNKTALEIAAENNHLEMAYTIEKYIIEFDKKHKWLSEFKKETVVMNRAKNAIKRAKIPRIKNTIKL